MSEFPHLSLPNRIEGIHKPRPGRSGAINPNTQANLDNRETHGISLRRNVNTLSNTWQQQLLSRRDDNLPELPNPETVPVFLQVDVEKFKIDSVKGLGIEIISEEEDGYIIGASHDNFASLQVKLESFLQEQGQFKNQASQLWRINDDLGWRVDQILSQELKDRWESITDDEELTVDVGIACYVKISDQPDQKPDEGDIAYSERLERWRSRKHEKEAEREEMELERQSDFQTLVEGYDGIMDSFVDHGDSFACRITVSGKALKDLVLNYQFIFEVVENEELTLPEQALSEAVNVNPNLLPPPEDAPKVCVIDSGIQEAHRLLSAAIDSPSSQSFIAGDASTADVASGGGHGTRVAGAILYPHEIPNSGDYQLPFYIQNARVLLSEMDGTTILPKELYPPKLMEDIVAKFEGTRVFNMSINAFSCCRLVHMSQWAATIDKLMHENDILFVLSAGNISRIGSEQKPGVSAHLDAGREYPDFLLQPTSRIGNPAQSAFALTVGSVSFDKFDDGLRESFGSKDSPSAFSRAGLGLWGMIKPDVVEYAGDFVREKQDNPNISTQADTSPTLVRSTIDGGSEVGSDTVGTSFAAPKVSSIAATLQHMYPNESSNLYRALIAQSARLPEAVFANPVLNHIQHYGYGIPDLQRATENSEKRITMITSDNVQAKNANVYSIQVPEEMRAPGEEYDVLVEVTLAFTARTRRTRRGSHSYMSTWLDWHSSKFNETLEQFKLRVLKDMDDLEVDAESQDTIPWVIRENKEWSKITGLRRQDSTLQKSWCLLKSHQLPEALSIAVAGHCGWEPDLSEEVDYSLTVSFEALGADINVYNSIRVENEIEVPVEVEVER